MRFKTRMMLTIGCVGLLAMSIPALSIPALSKPALYGADHKPRAQNSHANQNKKLAQRPANGKLHAVKTKLSAQAKAKAAAEAAREARATRLVSMPLTEEPQRPMLGWPALVSEARKYLGTNPTARSKLWCATFMNLVLAKVGYAGTNSDSAKSFAFYGHRVSSPQIGAIAVLTRGNRGGHVGVVSGIDKNGNPIIISGNHGDRVGEAIYPRSRVIAYVMPTDRRPVDTRIAERSQPNRAPAEQGIDSPITELLAAIEAEQRNDQKSELQRPPERIAEAPRPPQAVAPPRSPEPPHRVVQQAPDQLPTMYRAGTEPVDPRVANMIGRKDHAQSPLPPREPLVRQRQVQRERPGHLARAEAARTDTGISGVLGLR
jgi:uncharacterized protein (TIGR02594 family)